MAHIFSRLFWISLILFTFPATLYGSGSGKNHLIKKQKLICLYEQVDDLLKKPDDQLVMVFLTDTRTQAGEAENDGTISRSLPTMSLAIDASKPTSNPHDLLMLTHIQLKCFKSNFKNLIIDQRDPVPVEFKNTCVTDEEH